MYHATGVAFVYGIVIIIVYEALVQLPRVLEHLYKLLNKCCSKCFTCIKKIQGNHSNSGDDSNSETQVNAPGSIQHDETSAEPRGSIQDHTTVLKNVCICTCLKSKNCGNNCDS